MKKLSVLVLAGAVLCLALTAHGGDSDNSMQAIAPFLDDSTFAVVRANLGKLDIDAIAGRLADLGLPEKELKQAKSMASMILRAITDAGGKEAFIVWTMAGRPDEPFLVLPTKDQQAARGLSAFLRKAKQSSTMDSEAAGSAVVAGEPETLQQLRRMTAKARPDLAKALASAGDAAVQAAFAPPAILRKSLREAFPELPKALGGGSTRDLEQGFKWAAGSLQITPKFALEWLVQAKDAKTARKLQEFIGRVLDRAPLAEFLPGFASNRKLLLPEVKGDRLVLALDDEAFQKAVKPALTKMRAAAQRAQSMNNLKQLALAMHNYHDAYRGFPTRASFDAQGNALLSWRVHILPFVEQQPLYKKFKLDEPWDSAHNKKLIPLMPAVYRSPFMKNAGDGKSCYLGLVGKSAFFAGQKGIRMADIRDGTSNTLMIVEVNDANAVPWTKPADFAIDAKAPLKRLIRPGANAFLAAFCDGSVRHISRTIDEKTLRALFTRDGAETIGDVP